MKSISVYCASSIGKKPIYRERAYAFGKYLASLNKRVIFGGSHLGLMGAVANGALDNGGEVTGVLPRFMSNKEIAHPNLTELIMVDSMHERKLRMHELSEGVITLPGGFGTFEELFEMLTWAQLDLHKKPIGILNIEGYYDALKQMIDRMLEEGLLKSKYASLLNFSDNEQDLVQLMEKQWTSGEDKDLARKHS